MSWIYQTNTDEDRALVRTLFWEYLQWANEKVNQTFGVNFDIQSMLEHDMDTLDIFLPPHGRLLLATEENLGAGLACMKRSQEEIAEIKRMYVRPDFRGQGIGRGLLDGLLKTAKEMGYSKVRLDSAKFMEAAHTLYRSAGFQEIEPYPESEIPPDFQVHWVFMEKDI